MKYLPHHLALLLVALLMQFTAVQAQWQPTNGPYGGSVCHITASGSMVAASTGTGGVYISTNHGASWTRTNTGISANSRVYELSSSTTRVFAATSSGLYCYRPEQACWTRCTSASNDTAVVFCVDVVGEKVIAGGCDRILLSDDNGDSWEAIRKEYPEPTAFAWCSGNIIASYAEYPHFLVSADRGATWQDAIETPGGARCFAVRGDSIAAGTWHGVYVSIDKGLTWEKSASGMTDSSIADIVWVGDTLFAATNHTLYFSNDAGTSWINASISGLSNNAIFKLAASSGILFAGTVKGIARSVDKGEWVLVNNNFACAYTLTLATHGNTIFAGTYQGAMRSANHGNTWTTVASDVLTDDVAVKKFAVSRNALFAGTQMHGLLRSPDNGTTWEVVDGLKDSAITALAAYGDTIFAGGDETGLYRSFDNGATWVHITSGLPEKLPKSILINGGKIFAAFWDKGIFISDDFGESWRSAGFLADLALIAHGNKLFASTWGRSSFSSDNGATWVQHEGQTFWSAVFDASSSNIFAGDFMGGVYRSVDNGTTWTDINDGFGDGCANALVIKNDTLFAGTGYYGVLRRSVSEITNVKPPRDPHNLRHSALCKLENASSGIMLNYQITKTCPVSLTLFSISGEKCASYLPGIQAAGSYRVKVPSGNLPTGVYVYRFSAGSTKEHTMVKIVR